MSTGDVVCEGISVSYDMEVGHVGLSKNKNEESSALFYFGEVCLCRLVFDNCGALPR